MLGACKVGPPEEHLVPAAELLSLLATVGCDDSCLLLDFGRTSSSAVHVQDFGVSACIHCGRQSEMLRLSERGHQLHGSCTLPLRRCFSDQVLSVLDQADTGEIKLPAWPSGEEMHEDTLTCAAFWS